jgi:hypothetical protein
MKDKIIAELEREAIEFQKAAKSGNLKWLKKRNEMKHLTPKKKKRK